MKRKDRQKRTFSEEVKKKAVRDIENSKATIAQVCREYKVSSASVYKWLNKYSGYLQKGAKLVVELNSEGYRSKELERHVKELEAALGRKQMEIDFLEKSIEEANQEMAIDIKKKLFTRSSTGSGAGKGQGPIK
jgi:transposase